MALLTISSKGQVTIPAKIRAHLGINTKDKVQILIRDDEIILKPAKSFRELRGTISFKKGDSRKKALEAVSKHVLEMDN
jgi:AbrB family looped-hinge helix DNA binding protein